MCFRNGYRLDVAALAALCRERGAYLMLDDYQRTGTAPLDVHALGVDFLVTGALKYLLGPAGIAFLYVRRDLIERLEPLSTGWFGRVDPFAFSLDPLDWAASARRFEAGTPPVPNAYAAAAGLDLLNALGPAAIDAQIRRLTARMIGGARSRGFAVATPDDPEQRGALVVVRCRRRRHARPPARGPRDRRVGPGHRPARVVPRLQHRRGRGRGAGRARRRSRARLPGRLTILRLPAELKLARRHRGCVILPLAASRQPLVGGRQSRPSPRSRPAPVARPGRPRRPPTSPESAGRGSPGSWRRSPCGDVQVLLAIGDIPGEPHDLVGPGAGSGERGDDVLQRLVDLPGEAEARERPRRRVPANLARHEDGAAGGADRVGVAHRPGPSRRLVDGEPAGYGPPEPGRRRL